MLYAQTFSFPPLANISSLTALANIPPPPRTHADVILEHI